MRTFNNLFLFLFWFCVWLGGWRLGGWRFGGCWLGGSLVGAVGGGGWRLGGVLQNLQTLACFRGCCRAFRLFGRGDALAKPTP